MGLSCCHLRENLVFSCDCRWRPGHHILSPLPGVTFRKALTSSGAYCSCCFLSPGPLPSHSALTAFPGPLLATSRPQHQCHFCREAFLDPFVPLVKDGPFLDNLRVPSSQHLKQQCSSRCGSLLFMTGFLPPRQ